MADQIVLSEETTSNNRATPFDASKFLKDGETIRYYLHNAIQDGDPRLIRTALSDIEKALKTPPP